MKQILEEILEDAKSSYKEAVLLDNEILEEKLLSIITNAKLLLNKEKTYQPSFEIDENEEVAKIKRRVPKWINNPNQYNSKILNSYMILSNNNKFPVVVSTLQKHSGLSSDIFYKNYNQMKIIAQRNHGKVFEESNGSVILWQNVSDYIVNLYKKDR